MDLSISQSASIALSNIMHLIESLGMRLSSKRNLSCIEFIRLSIIVLLVFRFGLKIFYSIVSSSVETVIASSLVKVISFHDYAT